MNKALVIGSVNIDKTYELEHIVRPGETVRSLKLRSAWGGKGLNQAIALAKAGASVSLAAQVAAEDMEALKKYARENGLDASLVRSVSVPTGHAIIQVDAGGQNCIIVESGANGAMETETVTAALSGYGAGDILVLQNEIGLMPDIIRAGSSRGMTVVLNPSPITADIFSWPLELIDIFIVNETEGAAFAETEESEEAPATMGGKRPEEILAGMRGRYPEAAVLLTLGEDGAMYSSASEMIRIPAVKTDAVDTTAAGDTFTGYFLSGLLRGAGVRESMELAARAAAITVSRKGAADSIPHFTEV